MLGQNIEVPPEQCTDGGRLADPETYHFLAMLIMPSDCCLNIFYNVEIDSNFFIFKKNTQKMIGIPCLPKISTILCFIISVLILGYVYKLKNHIVSIVHLHSGDVCC